MLLIYYVNRCVSIHTLIVAIRSDSMLGLSVDVWVDGRSGSLAKTKTKQAMQLKLAGRDYGI